MIILVAIPITISLLTGIALFKANDRYNQAKFEKNKLKNNFYNHNSNLITITFDENKVVSYFYFQVEGNKSFKFKTFPVANIDFGVDSYRRVKSKSDSEIKNAEGEDIDRPESIIKSDQKMIIVRCIILSGMNTEKLLHILQFFMRMFIIKII